MRILKLAMLRGALRRGSPAGKALPEDVSRSGFGTDRVQGIRKTYLLPLGSQQKAEIAHFALRIGKSAAVTTVLNVEQVLERFVASTGKGRSSCSRAGETEHQTEQNQRISVFVICSVRLIREAIAHLFSAEEAVIVVGHAEDLDDGVDAIRTGRPDLVLVDVSREDGPGTISRLSEQNRDSKIVALGISEVERDVVACAEAGAVAYLTRHASVADAIEAFQSAKRGEASCSPRITATLLRRVRTLAAERGLAREETHFTTREIEVIELVARGLSNKEIGQVLSIEVATVKNHVHNIFQKLNIHRRAQAISWLRGQVDFPSKKAPWN
jgi:two-component system, NarL family, nitrate/nitrite response regulator NarL